MLKKSAAGRFVSILSSLMFMFTFIIGSFPVSAVTYDYYTLKYEAGDVDDIVGSTTVSYQRIAGVSFDVAASSRFSRKGYKLTSWTIPSTGEIVSPSSQYTMPANDITFVANWTPENYQITLAGVGGVTEANESNVYINGTCGDVINLPENPFTKSGYVFSGWKYDGITYDEGAEFTVPGVLSGDKIVISAVWTKGTASTTTAVTTVTTTTTTTTTTAAVTTTASETLGEDVKEKIYTVDTIMDNADNNTYKIYLYKLIKTNYTVYKVNFNFSADCDNIGQVSMAIGTTLKDGAWYQKDFNEYINGNSFSIDFGDIETCNNLKYASSFQANLWYIETTPINLDSITIYYTEPETAATTSAVTTSAETTTTTVTTVETTTETTVSTTAETTTTSVNTTAATTVSTTPASTLKPSQFSKFVEVNRQIGSSNGNMLSISGSEIVSANQIPESLEITISADSAIENYNMSVFMNLENGGYSQKDVSCYTSDNRTVIQIELDEAVQQSFTKNATLNMGYWWGTNSDISIESIKVNYRIDKGDYNSDGVVDIKDAEALQKYLVEINVEGMEFNAENTDVNGDGVINVFDYMELTRML